ncbi:MAG: hypothetical protein P8R02_01565 [Pseudomonadales bacterium]|nr:hypothetical protein [Pseudomonadales bacterium]
MGVRRFIIALSLIVFGIVLGWWFNNTFTVTSPATENISLRVFSGKDGSLTQVLHPSIDMGLSEQADSVRFTFDDINQQETVFAQLLVTYEVAASANQSTLEAYLNTAIASRDPLFNYNVASILIERYTSIDPQAALAFITNDARFGRLAFVAHILTSWIRQDPEAALDYFASITDQQLRNQVGLRLLQDPLVISAGWEAEIAAILGPSANNIVEMARLDRLDPEFAFEDALNGYSSTRMLNLRSTTIRWVRHDATRALERLLMINNINEKQQLLYIALAEYAKTSASAALAFVQQYQPDNRDLEQQMLLAMATQDFQASLPLLTEYEQRTGRSIVPLMISQWASQDPESAVAYSETLPEEQKREAYNYLIGPYFASEPDKAAAWVLALGTEYEALQENAMDLLAQHPQAETYITQLTSPALKQQLVKNISAAKAELNPEEALRWIGQYDNEPFYSTSVQHIFNRWAHRDPADAADALGDLDIDYNAGYADAIVSNIGNRWMNSSPRDAIDWLVSLPDGNAKQTAIASLVTRVGRDEADVAFSLISEILDDTRKQEASLNLAIRWAYKNPNDMEQIIIDLGLSESKSNQLRDFLRNNSHQL